VPIRALGDPTFEKQPFHASAAARVCFKRWGYVSSPLKKCDAKPKVYGQSRGGDLDFASHRRRIGRMNLKCCADASAIVPARVLHDSARIFKRLPSAVCAYPSRFCHIDEMAAVATKESPD
jgi:hypothetical protein